MLSKLAIEIYSCSATTAGIEKVFSVAGHLIGTRATTTKDEHFEQILFGNVNQEVMSGGKRKFVEVPEINMVRSGIREFLTSSFGKNFWC